MRKDESFVFVVLLRACTKSKDLCRGIRLHVNISRKSMLQDCADALVTMYAKCGALDKAKELFDIHNSMDVFTWTALIAGYTQMGQGQDALDCFEQMQRKGIVPDAVTYTCVLTACGTIKAADKGEKIHHNIAKQGLLGGDIVLSTALVDMYCQCGILAKAQRVLEELPIRNVTAWNALISGYVQHGDGTQALSCLEHMKCEGIVPDWVTFICILKACGIIQAAEKGERIHDEIVKQGLLLNDVMLGTALIDMYAKCGALMKARQVLEELTMRNVMSWNALIMGYVQRGEAKEALNCFEQMKHEGILPDVVTCISAMKACGTIGAADKGEKIQDQIVKQGLLQNEMVCNALVDMYAKCGALAKAREVLEELPVQNVVSWTTIIAGYTQLGNATQALSCFEQMQRDGLYPDVVTLVCILKACGSIRAGNMGARIHDNLCKQRLLKSDVELGNALVDMYVKCGALKKARQVFEELPLRQVVSWNALIAGYVQHDEGEEALILYEAMLREGLSPDVVTYASVIKACSSTGALEKGESIHDEISSRAMLSDNLVLGTVLVDMYVKCSVVVKARQVIEELPARDVICWNALISGYAKHAEGKQVLMCFERMQEEGITPDSVTFMCVLKACGSLEAVDKGERVHEQVAKQGLLGDGVMLGTAIIDMYAKCGALAKAWQVLDSLPVRNVASWNALIVGYAEQGNGAEAMEAYEGMQREGLCPNAVTFICILKACGTVGAIDMGERIHDEISKQGLLKDDDVLGNALVDMYAKCDYLNKALEVLEELPTQNVTCWTSLIAGYAQQNKGVEALKCLERMERDGLLPNAVTFTCILKACVSIGAAAKGKEIHDEIGKQGLLGKDNMLGTALVDMYAKCGALPKARQLLKELPVGNVTSWNALLAGYAQQCQGICSFHWLEQMQHKGIAPNAATFSCMLNICSRTGLIKDAQMCVLNMSTKYGMKPELEHYACMVDLFGRAGHLEKAVGVIEKLPFSSSEAWSVLLGACRKWGDVHVGRWAFEHAMKTEKSDASIYALMADLYAAAGMHENAEYINAMRIESKAWKGTGWIDNRKNVCSFLVGDTYNNLSEVLDPS